MRHRRFPTRIDVRGHNYSDARLMLRLLPSELSAWKAAAAAAGESLSHFIRATVNARLSSAKSVRRTRS